MQIIKLATWWPLNSIARNTLAVITIASLLFFGGCKKDFDDDVKSDVFDSQTALALLKTDEEKNFFNTSFVTQTNPLIKKPVFDRNPDDTSVVWLYNTLLQRNQINHGIPRFVQKYGYPAWNWGQTLTDSIGTEAILVPFARKDANTINGYLAAFKSPTSNFILIIDKHNLDSMATNLVDNYENLGFFIANYMMFNSDMFDRVDIPQKDWIGWKLQQDSVVSIISTERDLCDDFPITAPFGDPKCPTFGTSLEERLEDLWHGLADDIRQKFTDIKEFFSFLRGCSNYDIFFPFIDFYDFDDPENNGTFVSNSEGGGIYTAHVNPEKYQWFNTEITQKCQLYEDWSNGEWGPGGGQPVTDAEKERCEDFDKIRAAFPTVDHTCLQDLFYLYSSNDTEHDVTKIINLSHHANFITKTAIEKWLNENCGLHQKTMELNEYVWRYTKIYGTMVPKIGLTATEANNLINNLDKIYEYLTIVYLNENPEHINYIIVESPNLALPSLDGTTMICEAMFDFQFNSTQSRRAYGLRKVRYRVPVNGVNTDFVFDRLFFETTFLGGLCGETINKKTADALNNARVAVINQISTGTLPQPNITNMSLRIKHALMIAIYGQFSVDINTCAGDNSIFESSVRMLNEFDFQIEEDLNVIFKNFETDFDSTCN